MSFLLNVDQDEYLGSIDDVAGLVAVIHDQNTVPFPEDEGLAIHPGELLSIGVKKVKQYRIDNSILRPSWLVYPSLPQYHVVSHGTTGDKA